MERSAGLCRATYARSLLVWMNLKCIISSSLSHRAEWSTVATWKWNVKDEEACGICRMAFDGCCPDCKMPGDDCPLGMGGLLDDYIAIR